MGKSQVGRSKRGSKIHLLVDERRVPLALWLVTVALGVGIFLTWYAPGGATAAPPAATEEPTPRPPVAAAEEVEVAETEEAGE